MTFAIVVFIFILKKITFNIGVFSFTIFFLHDVYPTNWFHQFSCTFRDDLKVISAFVFHVCIWFFIPVFIYFSFISWPVWNLELSWFLSSGYFAFGLGEILLKSIGSQVLKSWLFGYKHQLENEIETNILLYIVWSLGEKKNHLKFFSNIFFLLIV